jgi:SOS response regulatory protein OraA/RecX
VAKLRSAVDTALRSLRQRDLSEHELVQRLATRGFTERDCQEAMATLRRTGLVDDRRFAELRAASLAARGAGDALVRDALGRAGVDAELAEDVVAELEPEAVRARRIVERRGRSPKTARYLASRGFTADAISELIANGSCEEIG